MKKHNVFERKWDIWIKDLNLETVYISSEKCIMSNISEKCTSVISKSSNKIHFLIDNKLHTCTHTHTHTQLNNSEHVPVNFYNQK